MQKQCLHFSLGNAVSGSGGHSSLLLGFVRTNNWLISMIWQWWVKRSTWAMALALSCKMLSHCLNGKLVVISVNFRLYWLLKALNRGFTPFLSRARQPSSSTIKRARFQGLCSKRLKRYSVFASSKAFTGIKEKDHPFGLSISSPSQGNGDMAFRSARVSRWDNIFCFAQILALSQFWQGKFRKLEIRQ